MARLKSIIVDDLEHCIICGSSNVQIHHTHGGINRKNSDKYGMIVPLCMEHHTGTSGVHNNRELDLKIKKNGQSCFERIYGHEKYMEIFGKNYL